MSSWPPASRAERCRLAAALAVAIFVVAAVAPQDVGEPPGGELTLGVVGFYNPRLMYLKYQPMVEYLARHTGRPWRLQIGTTYEDTVQSLCRGELTMAYFGPYAYLRARARCGAEPIVRLQSGGKATYRSQILVRQDSPIQRLEDLRGRSMAFGAPLSMSAHVMPRAMLAAAGVGDGELACRFYGHHERAARAVLLGEVDACGIRDLVGERFRARGLRVVATSDPIPNFPFAVPQETPAVLRAQLIDVLVELPRRNSRAALEIASWDPELSAGFSTTSDAEYDGARRLVQRVLGPDAAVIAESSIRCGSAP